MKIGSKVKVVTLTGSKQAVINGVRDTIGRQGVRDTIGRQGVLVADTEDSQPYLVEFDNGDTFWYYPGELEEVKEEVK